MDRRNGGSQSKNGGNQSTNGRLNARVGEKAQSRTASIRHKKYLISEGSVGKAGNNPSK
jgi:hypothetical protein